MSYSNSATTLSPAPVSIQNRWEKSPRPVPEASSLVPRRRRTASRSTRKRCHTAWTGIRHGLLPRTRQSAPNVKSETTHTRPRAKQHTAGPQKELLASRSARRRCRAWHTFFQWQHVGFLAHSWSSSAHSGQLRRKNQSAATAISRRPCHWLAGWCPI